jgi:hypothetical protein
MNHHYRDTVNRPVRGCFGDGPNDNDRVEIGPTQLALVDGILRVWFCRTCRTCANTAGNYA